MRSRPRMTPWANAAARVPPPENASATIVLPLMSGGGVAVRMAASDATRTLLGSLNEVALEPSRTAPTTVAVQFRSREPPILRLMMQRSYTGRPMRYVHNFDSGQRRI